MSIVRQLAELTYRNIKDSQNFLTRRSRIQALKKFASVLEDPNASDDEIIFIASQQREWIAKDGGFGIRGRSGSNFLREIDQLNHQFFYLRNHENDPSRSPIKKLADLMVEDIQKAQNKHTDASRLLALTNFKQEIAPAEVSDQAILLAAQKQKNNVLDNGKFGFWGRAGSNFLNKMNHFIQQATHLIRQTKAETVIKEAPIAKPSTPFTHSLFAEMQKKSGQFHTKPAHFIPAIYDLKDKRRDMLEEGIKKLLEKEFGKMEKISRAWRYRIDKVVTGEIDPDCNLFFEHYAAQLFPLSKLALPLQEKLLAYQEIMADKAYIQARKNHFVALESDTLKDIFQLKRAKEMRENDNDLSNTKKQRSKFFAGEQYSVYKSSDQYLVDKAIKELEEANPPLIVVSGQKLGNI